jgi:hypothetical protein
MHDLDKHIGTTANGEASQLVAKDYLAQMARTYTTDEQRRIHEGETPAAAPAQSVEFF